MGSNGLGFKAQAGDRATPEGHYRIVARKDQGQSRYHKALLLDYPNEVDRRRLAAAKRQGLVSMKARLGGLIEIHGEGGRGEDWTNGCVAVTNANMDVLFGLVKVGTPVTIIGGEGAGGSLSSVAERLRGETQGG